MIGCLFVDQPVTMGKPYAHSDSDKKNSGAIFFVLIFFLHYFSMTSKQTLFSFLFFFPSYYKVQQQVSKARLHNQTVMMGKLIFLLLH